MPNEVQLAIEGNKESYIQEIALNGQETWIQPLSMSEKLQRATQRIDFYKVLTLNVQSKLKRKQELTGDEHEDEEQKKDEPQENPWESVRKNIVDALTEVRVLHDVLAILRYFNNSVYRVGVMKYTKGTGFWLGLKNGQISGEWCASNFYKTNLPKNEEKCEEIEFYR